MKKLALLAMLMLLTALAHADTITVDAFLSADDVTIAHLENFRTTVVDAINNADGANLQTGSVTHDKLDANTDPTIRWSESFNNYVYTGLLPVTATGLATDTSAGTAYVVGERVVKDATSHTYDDNLWTFVDLSNNGTYTYPTAVVGASEPAVTANSVRLARVTTSGGNITAVRDDRPLGISLTQEDFYIEGYEVVTMDATTVTIDSGIASNGGTRRSKVSQTALDISVASNYVSGVSQRGTSKWLHIYMSSTGDIRLSASAPDYHDTAGNAAGTKYYYLYGTSIYYRYLGSIRLNGEGLGTIDSYLQMDDTIIWDVPVSIATALSAGSWSAATSCAAGMPTTSFLGLFELVGGQAANDGFIFIRPANTSSTANADLAGIRGYNAWTGQYWCFTDESQQIQYQCESSDTTSKVALCGYRFKR